MSRAVSWSRGRAVVPASDDATPSWLSESQSQSMPREACILPGEVPGTTPAKSNENFGLCVVPSAMADQTMKRTARRAPSSTRNSDDDESGVPKELQKINLKLPSG